jgi:hypothetical protein
VTRLGVLAAILLAAAPAHAYEFWLRAQTLGQAYQLRDYRLVGPDLFFGRRRVTQMLALRIYDIGDLAHDRRVSHLPERGLRVSWVSYLRIDHDFGDYTAGRMQLPGPIVRDAIDVIPELADSSASLDLMYGYLQLDGLADDRLSIQLGRVLSDDGWGSFGVDGGHARYELPAPLAVSATAGLRVRAASPLGVSQYELDGTSGAGCQEYLAGPTPGTGSWQLIDRNRDVVNYRLSSDYEYCPQRDVAQPTVAVALATSRVHGFGAELGYRRTWSDSVATLGPAQGIDQPPQPLYPNEFGQMPATGVNEERLYAHVHGEIAAGDVKLSPYGDARFSLLHAAFDRVDAGVRVRLHDHVIEPAIEYFFPTFDGDSIFNAFSIEPTTDVRLGYAYSPLSADWRGTASAWLRHYGHEDGEPSLAGGFDAGVDHAMGTGTRARASALWDDGWGGRRVGGTAEAAWRDSLRTLYLRARAIVLDVHEDDRARGLQYVTSSAVVSTTYRLNDQVAFHAIAEADYDAIHDLQTRVIGVIDLAFLPEP